MRTFATLAVVLALAAAGRADEHEEIRAALHELKIVQRHLKAAPTSYEGHRLNALKAVEQALQEVRLALALAKREKQGGAAPQAGGADD